MSQAKPDYNKESESLPKGKYQDQTASMWRDLTL